MWNFAPFIAQAAALQYVALVLSREPSETSTSRGIAVASVLWALSWASVVTFLLFMSGQWNIAPGSTLRYLGYLTGSAVATCLPFLTLVLLRPALGAVLPRKQWRHLSLGVVAAVGLLLTPWLFYVGWIGGCVAVGEKSCL